MICADCNATLKHGEASCYRCGWKAPAGKAPVMPRAPEPIPEPTARSDAEIERMRQVTARRQPNDPRAWARRLLDRAAAGEKLSPMQIQYATEAVRSVPVEREPGSDDEESNVAGCERIGERNGSEDREVISANDGTRSGHHTAAKQGENPDRTPATPDRWASLETDSLEQEFMDARP